MGDVLGITNNAPAPGLLSFTGTNEMTSTLRVSITYLIASPLLINSEITGAWKRSAGKK